MGEVLEARERAPLGAVRESEPHERRGRDARGGDYHPHEPRRDPGRRKSIGRRDQARPEVVEHERGHLRAERRRLPCRAGDETEQAIGNEQPFGAVGVERQPGANRAARPPQPVRTRARPALAVGDGVTEEGRGACDQPSPSEPRERAAVQRARIGGCEPALGRQTRTGVEQLLEQRQPEPLQRRRRGPLILWADVQHPLAHGSTRRARIAAR